MSDRSDETQTFVLLALAGLLTLVIAGVLGLAIARTTGSTVDDGRSPYAAALQVVASEAGGRVYFESGSDALPVDSTAVLVRVADAARMDSGRVVLISGFHDATGDPVANADLAKRRALAVRHALEANGVAPDRLLLDKPAMTADSTDPREARRVDLRLR